MSQNILDLRKNSGRADVVEDDLEEPEKNYAGSHQNNAQDAGGDSIKWSAYEFEKRERGPYWFFLPGGVALVLVLLGILAKSYFFLAFVVLAFVTLAVYMRREPRMLNFALTKKGVMVGRQIYEYSSLKSFWIFDKDGIKELSLETEGALHPFVRIPLGDVEPYEARDYLRSRLKEEEQQESAVDAIVRILGI